MGFAFSGSGFVAGFALSEAERCAPGLDDAAVVRDEIDLLLFVVEDLNSADPVGS
ncbi:hypothetical protein [uncultured Roseovarius sp.]|uniref:hypothetical protein n=1 Tax=uncultured Roseovarius sp. TaxID=293344 RepID=UPI00260F8EAC|nr:hypothetical protein [uncultured Roseovarius sp.]